MGVQAADQNLLEPGTFSLHLSPPWAEHSSLSSAHPFFHCSHIRGLTTLTVRKFYLMSNLLDFNTAGLAHKKLGNPFPAKLIQCLGFYNGSNLGALCLGFIPMGSRSLEALIKSEAKIMSFTVKYFIPLASFFPLEIGFELWKSSIYLYPSWNHHMTRNMCENNWQTYSIFLECVWPSEPELEAKRWIPMSDLVISCSTAPLHDLGASVSPL